MRQEQLFQPKLNKLSLTSFVATEVGRRERGTSLQGEFSEARESGSATSSSQGRPVADNNREERLGLQARMSSSPPYSPQRSSTPGDIITIDRCLDHSLALSNENDGSAMPSQRSLQRGRQVRGGQKATEGGVDLLQTSLAMNFDLGLNHHLVRKSTDYIYVISFLLISKMILSPNHQVSGRHWPLANLSLYP